MGDNPQMPDEVCYACKGVVGPFVPLYVAVVEQPITFCIECVLTSLEVATRFRWRNQYTNWMALRGIKGTNREARLQQPATHTEGGVYVPEQTATDRVGEPRRRIRRRT